MADYTPLGIQKIAQQAERDPRTIRCPRDSVVMRVLASRAERSEGGEAVRQRVDGLPRGRGWRVTQVDVECPACRRQAVNVEVEPRLAGNAPVRPERIRMGTVAG
jgi:hypothetical protein